ncbi:hypothetical protein EMN47_19785 [Prolixibacteraceae bacterium JC049]|nr:hypothetical protein [Prolixibacteraceae bacterium JC049]
MRSYLYILILLLCFDIAAFGKVKNQGIPFIKNYPRSLYNAGTQNWDVAELSNGMVYFANNNGVLEYDGNNWRIIGMPNGSVVRSLFVDKNDQIYVGAYNELGYLKSDEKGNKVYHSLIQSIPEEDRDFEEVWQIIPYRNGILFHTFSKIFYYRDGKFSVLKNGNTFHYAFNVNESLYVMIPKLGLHQLKGQNFTLVNDGELLANKEVVGMFPQGKTRLLIATAQHGFYVSNGTEIKPWEKPIDKELMDAQMFSAVELSSELLAIGSVRDGLFIINKNGQLIQHINKKYGLQNNTILSLFKDNEQNLWLGLDNGIDYVEISSPISTFPNDRDFGAGYCSIYHNGHLYLGTNMGLFVSKYQFDSDIACKDCRFKLVKNTAGQVWSLQQIGGSLICGHNNGTYLIEGATAQLISNEKGGWKYLQSAKEPSLMVGGTYNGLVLFEKVNNKWQFKSKIKGFNESSREIIWENDRTLWMCHGYKGVFRIELNQQLDSCLNVKFYGEDKGFPSNLNINVARLRGETLFFTNGGFYKYVPELDKIQENSFYNKLLGQGETVHKMYEQANGDIWFFQGQSLGLMKLQVDNSYDVIRQPFASLKGGFLDAFANVNVVDEQNIFIGRENGFVHYNPQVHKRYDLLFKTLIREVRVTSAKSDSIIFFGGHDNSVVGQKDNRVDIPFRNNAIQFIYSSPKDYSSQKVEYLVKLVGFENEITRWEKKTRKEYTNLHEGDYTFEVLARNEYGVESSVDRFYFTVLPPWYRSNTAYFIYILFGFLVVVIVAITVRFRMKKVRVHLEEKQEQELLRQEREFREENLRAEKEIIKLRNDKLRNEVEFKNRELASSTMNIIHKNEVLTQTVGELKNALKKIKDPTAMVQIRKLIRTIDGEFSSEQDWEQFAIHFDQVHEDFLKKIRKEFPQLTPKDLKLCAYLRMNLSTKEIAPLMNISVRGVEISRYRLRKKLELDRDDNLIDFLLKI